MPTPIDRSTSIPVTNPSRPSVSPLAVLLSLLLGLAVPLALLLWLARSNLDLFQPYYTLVLAAVILDAVLAFAVGISTTRRNPVGAPRPSLSDRWTWQDTACIGWTNSALPPHVRGLPVWTARVWRPAYLWLSLQVPVLTAYWFIRHPNSIHRPRDLAPLVILVALWLLAGPIARAFIAYLSATMGERRVGRYLSYLVRSIAVLDSIHRTILRALQLQFIFGSRRPLEPQTVPIPDSAIPESATAEPPPQDAPAAADLAGTPVAENPVPSPSDAVTDASQNLEAAPAIARHGEGSASDTQPVPLHRATATSASQNGHATSAALLLSSASFVEVVGALEAERMGRARRIDELERTITSLEERSRDELSPLTDAIRAPRLDAAAVDSIQRQIQQLADDPDSLMTLASIASQAPLLLDMVDAIVAVRERLSQES